MRSIENPAEGEVMLKIQRKGPSNMKRAPATKKKPKNLIGQTKNIEKTKLSFCELNSIAWLFQTIYKIQ